MGASAFFREMIGTHQGSMFEGEGSLTENICLSSFLFIEYFIWVKEFLIPEPLFKNSGLPWWFSG